MVGICKKDALAAGFGLLYGNPFEAAQGANGHKCWRFDASMRVWRVPARALPSWRKCVQEKGRRSLFYHSRSIALFS